MNKSAVLGTLAVMLWLTAASFPVQPVRGQGDLVHQPYLLDTGLLSRSI